MGKKHDKAEVEGRRDFLKLTSLGTVVGGAALVTGSAKAADQESAERGGYRETELVKTYYETARF